MLSGPDVTGKFRALTVTMGAAGKGTCVDETISI
jgi:hypothetical protein